MKTTKMLELAMAPDRGDRVFAMSIPERRAICKTLEIKLSPGEKFSYEPVTRRILKGLNEMQARIVS